MLRMYDELITFRAYIFYSSSHYCNHLKDQLQTTPLGSMLIALAIDHRLRD